RELFALLDRDNGEVRGVAFAPGDGLAVTAAYDSAAAHLWDVQALREEWEERRRHGVLASARPLNPRLLHPAPVTAASFAEDVNVILTACEDGYVRVWRKAPGHTFTRLQHVRDDGPDPGDD